jgi:hypothetical protein
LDSIANDNSRRRHPRASLRRGAQILLVVLGSLALAGPADSANQNTSPVASFTFSPSAPVTGEAVAFTSTSTA